MSFSLPSSEEGKMKFSSLKEELERLFKRAKEEGESPQIFQEARRMYAEISSLQ